MATFEINGLRGTFDGTTFVVADPTLQNDILPPLAELWELEHGGAYLPNKVNIQLRFVMDLAGGRVVEPDIVADDPELKGRIYKNRVESL